MIIKVKTLAFCENFISTETFTYCLEEQSDQGLHCLHKLVCIFEAVFYGKSCWFEF